MQTHDWYVVRLVQMQCRLVGLVDGMVATPLLTLVLDRNSVRLSRAVELVSLR